MSSLYAELRQNYDYDDSKSAMYPRVPELTPSAKQRILDALEKDKEEKIREGFYQVNLTLKNIFFYV